MDRRSQLAAGAAFVCTLLVLHFRGAITNQRLGNVAMSSPRTAFRAPAAPPPAVVAPENQTPTQAPPLPTPPAEPTGSCRDDPTHLYPDSCVVQRMSQGGMVTLSTVSTGMVDFVHNLVYSMRVVGADQFVLVAEDEEAFSSLREWLGDAHVLRFPSAVDPGAAHSYNAPGYNKIVSRRPRLLLQLLQSTFSVLYTDVDIVWQRDPYPHLKCDGSYDFAAQADGPLYCTGFIHLCPTEHTRALVKAWAEAMEKKPTLNQCASLLPRSLPPRLRSPRARRHLQRPGQEVAGPRPQAAHAGVPERGQVLSRRRRAVAGRHHSQQLYHWRGQEEGPLPQARHVAPGVSGSTLTSLLGATAISWEMGRCL